MQRSLLLLGLAAATALVACARSESPDSPSDGAWVGTITTEGHVTTVINESGSVWGGMAELVEELSIGVEAGPDEYLFGDVEGIAVEESRVLHICRFVSHATRHMNRSSPWIVWLVLSIIGRGDRELTGGARGPRFLSAFLASPHSRIGQGRSRSACAGPLRDSCTREGRDGG